MDTPNGADRRAVVAGAAAALSAAALPVRAAADRDLTWTPAWKLREMIAARIVSPVEVLDHFLGRIEKLDPQLNAIRQLDREGARAQAKAAEAAVMRGEPLGVLHGVPMAVKEHLRVKGLLWNKFSPETPQPAPDNDVAVERLRKAGAIIVGTTVMPGMGRSAMAGQTGMDLAKHPRNPWDPRRIPGSSSAGSAAAVASGMLPMAIGSDGGGSTRLPGALCGLVGVHTARGRVPMINYQRPGTTLSLTFGPLARDVRDAATAMTAIAGPDGRDFVTLDATPPDFLGALGQGGAGLKLAWTDNFGFASMYALPQTPRVIEAVRRAAQNFTALGARLEPTTEVWEDFFPSLLVTNAAYSESGGGGPKPDPADLRAASEVRARNHDRFWRLFERYDLLLSPTIQFTAPRVEDWDAAWNQDGDKYPHKSFGPTYTSNTFMFNWLGWPALSIPVGFLDGLPIGLQIIAKPEREAMLYRAAAAYLKAYPRNERPPVS